MTGFSTFAERLRFYREYRTFRRMARSLVSRFPLRWKDRRPCLQDRTSSAAFDRHYIYHTAWAARVLARSLPASHVDIASSLYFAAIISAFIPMRLYEYRPAGLHLSNLSSESADLLSLPFPDRSLASLSCMHVVEHVGLGRYGDPLDPDGDRKAASELQRVLAPHGSLLFVVPVGRPRVVFNAHRVYSFRNALGLFPELRLREFALIPDHPQEGGLVENADPGLVDRQDYGCGCFHLEREG